MGLQGTSDCLGPSGQGHFSTGVFFGRNTFEVGLEFSEFAWEEFPPELFLRISACYFPEIGTISGIFRSVLHRKSGVII